MAVERIQQWKVRDEVAKKTYVFDSEQDAERYNKLVEDTSLRDKIMTEIIPSIVEYIETKQPGEKSVSRDWSTLAFWEFHRRGYLLPPEVKKEDWFIPKEIVALKKAVADNPSPGDQLGDDDAVQPEGRTTSKAA